MPFIPIYDSLININIVDGIGAGMSEGILFSEENGIAGEMSHMRLFPNGKAVLVAIKVVLNNTPQ